MKNNNSIQFIHANGFPTKAYSSLINKIEKNYNVIPNELFSNEIDLKKIKSWDLFTKRFLEKLDDNKKHIGIGHSIGHFQEKQNLQTMMKYLILIEIRKFSSILKMKI